MDPCDTPRSMTDGVPCVTPRSLPGGGDGMRSGIQLTIGALVRVRNSCTNICMEGVITDFNAEAVKVLSVKDGVARCERVFLDSACVEFLRESSSEQLA